MFRIVVLGVITLAAWLSYQRFFAPKPVAEVIAPTVEERVIRPPSIQRDTPMPSALSASPSNAATNQSFKCDGRTYCSQMTSCAEAKFFLANCPDTKMDGDRDGIPCEEQHCGH